MAPNKSLPPIKADQVGQIFDDTCIERLARIAKLLPDNANKLNFAEGVRAAVYAYAEDVRALSGDELRAEILKLRDAANFKLAKRPTDKKYEKVARLLEQLSPEADKLLTDRAARISRRAEPTKPRISAIGRNGEVLRRKLRVALSIKLPTPDHLRDAKQRDQACKTIVSLCSNRGRPVDLPGSPSRNKVISQELYAPQIIYDVDKNEPAGKPKRKRRPKRKAELQFVGALRLAYLKATGIKASRTASWHQPGPFVRFVKECLQLVSAYDADHAANGAARLINDWDRRHQEVKKEMAQKLRRVRAEKSNEHF